MMRRGTRTRACGFTVEWLLLAITVGGLGAAAGLWGIELTRQQAAIRRVQSRLPSYLDARWLLGKELLYQFPSQFLEAERCYASGAASDPYLGPWLDLCAVLRYELANVISDITDLDLHYIGTVSYHPLLGEMTDKDWELLLGSFPRIWYAGLNRAPIQDRQLRYLAKARGLGELHLSSTKITGEGLSWLRGLRCLRRLDLREVELSDAGKRALADLSNLYELQVVADDSLLAQLPCLKNLSSLWLFPSRSPTRKLTDAGLQHLKDLRSLTMLYVETPYISDRSMVILSQLPNLQYLYVISDGVTDAGVASIAQSAAALKLGTVRIESRQLTDKALWHLGGLIRLRALEIAGDHITDGGIRHLRFCKALDWLQLRRTAVTGAGVADLVGLCNPGVLDLSGSAVTDEGLAAIARLAELRTLTLDDTRVTGTGFRDFPKMKKLTTLHLARTPVSDEGLRTVSQMGNVRRLSLAGTAITEWNLRHLAAMENLEELDLSGTRVTGEGISWWDKMRGLRELNLDNTPFNDAGLKRLKAAPRLTLIRLEGTKVTREGVYDFHRAHPDVSIYAARLVPELRWRMGR